MKKAHGWISWEILESNTLIGKKISENVTHQIGRRRIIVGEFEEVGCNGQVEVFGTERAAGADFGREAFHHAHGVDSAVQ